MLAPKKILETLGGPQKLKRTVGSWDSLHELILGGLPYSTYTHLLSAFKLTASEAATIFQIPTRARVTGGVYPSWPCR